MWIRPETAVAQMHVLSAGLRAEKHPINIEQFEGSHLIVVQVWRW